MADRATTVEVDGRPLRVTNLDKVMYPDTGTTKGDVIAYYQAVASTMVPHVAGRPATRKRWVHGVAGHAFFTKNADSGTPDWVRTLTLEHSRDTASYPVIDDAATLVFLAQLAALEIHVPQWRVEAGVTALAEWPPRPDRLVLDLDPGEGAGLDECVEVALLIKEVLDGVGMVSVPVTSGSKGIHLYAGLDGHLTSAEASEFARQLALAFEASHPQLVVSDMKRELRGGKVFLDWSQNNGAKTTVSPYSLRGRALPWVAAPRHWSELVPGVGQLTFTQVVERLATIGDPLAVLLPASAAGEMTLEGGPGPNRGESGVESHVARNEPDRLSAYRSKRDATKTPEPVPDGPVGPGGGNSFVIQEHHARRLHHDFRLEHDGVLVSWAVPKLTPLVPKVNHLAVQTEDHPLEYGAFEGSIPQGEYGGGEVTIWDAGVYEASKWRDGAEVIVTLHGRPDGGLGGVPREYVLIHTGHGDAKNWLIHLRADQAELRREPPEVTLDDIVNRAHSTSPAPTQDTSTDRECAPVTKLDAPGGSTRGAEAPNTVKRAHWTLEALPGFDPMLATAATASEVTGDDWHFEVKWDGYRGIARVADGRWAIGSRRGLDLTQAYPELAGVVELVGSHAAVIDGEIVAIGPDGRASFELLQNHGRGAAPAHYMAFDLLWLDGESLLTRPYVERRAALEDLIGDQDRFVHVPTTFGTDRELALGASKQLGLEGLIAKRPEAGYSAGRRSRAWLKLKNVAHQSAIVVGWRPGDGNRSGTIGSLLLAVNDGDRLSYIGRVGSGFTDRGLSEALEVLRPLAQATPPLGGVPRPEARGANWVEPVLVGEVSYAEWTSSGTMRHPVWRGWRPDADPSEVVREG